MTTQIPHRLVQFVVIATMVLATAYALHNSFATGYVEMIGR